MKLRVLSACVLLLTLVFALLPAALAQGPVPAGRVPPGVAAVDPPVWQPLGPTVGSSVWDVSFSPAFAADGTAFASSGRALWKTTDGGDTWRPTGTFSFGEQGRVWAAAISPDYAVDNTIVVGTLGEGVYRSTDGGQTWAQCNQGLLDLNVVGLGFSPSYAIDHIIFAGTVTAGVFRTQDGGASWHVYNVSPSGLALPGIRVFAFSPNFHLDRRIYAVNGDDLFGFSASGWACINPTPSEYTDVVVSPGFASDNTVFACSHSGGGSVFRSTDRGSTWERLMTGGSFDVDWLTISPSYVSDLTIVAGLAGVVQVSTDRGDTWQPLSPAPPGACSDLQFAPGYPADGTLLAVSDGKVYRSHSLGGAWQLVASDLPVPVHARQVAISPNYDSDRLLLACQNSWDPPLSRSSDRGASWTAASGARAWLAAFSPNLVQDHAAYAMRDASQLYVSADDGQTFTPQVGPGIGVAPSALVLSPNYAADNTIVASAPYWDLWRSTDRGTSWKVIHSDSHQQVAFSPQYASDRTLWAAHQNTVRRSTDGGSTWTLRNAGLPMGRATTLALSPAYATDKTLFIGLAGNGLWRSTNAGQSWSKVATGLGSWEVRGLAFDPDYASSHTLYAGTYGGGVYVSGDAGASWTELNEGLVNRYVEHLALSGGERRHLFASTIEGVWRLVLRDVPEGPTVTPTATATATPTGTPTPTATRPGPPPVYLPLILRQAG